MRRIYSSMRRRNMAKVVSSMRRRKIAKIVGGKGHLTFRRGPAIPPKQRTQRVPTAKEAETLAGLVNSKSFNQHRQIVGDWLNLFKKTRSKKRRLYLWDRLNLAVADSWGIAHKTGIGKPKPFTKAMIPKK